MSDQENLDDYRRARQDELNRLSREERLILLEGEPPRRSSARRPPRRSRRWWATNRSGCTLPDRRRPRPGARPGATADAVIVLWMAGGMASTETFDPKRYTPFAPGVPIKDVLSTFPSIDTEVDHIKFTQGLENIAERDRQGHAHPHLHRRGPRLHPAFAAPVSLAHRLHPAATAGDAAYRRRSSRARSARRTRTCRRLSPSARRSRAPAKSAR